MKLTKYVPAKFITIEFKWLKKEFTKMSPEFRRIRAHMSDPMDSCYWCKHKFEDGEMMALGNIKGKGENHMFCQSCVAEDEMLTKDYKEVDLTAEVQACLGKNYNGHILYNSNDSNIPEGYYKYVAEWGLSICRICGKAEVELDEPCTGKLL